MTKYRGKLIHTLTDEDVGHTTIRVEGCGHDPCPRSCGHRRTVFLSAAFGRVQEIDVGKQVLEVVDRTGQRVVSVENQAQMEERTADE